MAHPFLRGMNEKDPTEIEYQRAKEKNKTVGRQPLRYPRSWGRGRCVQYAPNYFCMLRAEPIAVNDVPDRAMTLPGVPSFRNAHRTGTGITASIQFPVRKVDKSCDIHWLSSFPM